MDFSSNERALKSLQLRRPPLSPEIQSLSQRLLPLECHPLQDITTFVQCTLELLRLGTTAADSGNDSNSTTPSVKKHKARWEPLAVGLHVSISFLEAYRQRIEHNSDITAPVVFMDGPRVPATTAADSDCPGEERVSDATTPVVAVPCDDTERDATAGEERAVMTDDGKTEVLIGFCRELGELCRTHLEHDEPRVRTLVAKAAGEHTKLATALYFSVGEEEEEGGSSSSSSSLAACGGTILSQSLELYRSTCESLYQHLKVGREAAESLAKETAEAAAAAASAAESTTPSTATPTTQPPQNGTPANNNTPMSKISKTSTGALDDTTGWRALETNLYGVASFICASSHFYFRLSSLRPSDITHAAAAAAAAGAGGPQDRQEEEDVKLDERLMEAVKYCCVTHINRHVRAAGINLLEQMVHAATSPPPNTTNNNNTDTDNTNRHLVSEPTSSLYTTIVQVLRESLADNWSQVRMAASVLTRTFLLAFPPNHPSLPKVHLQLLPRMCLNRFYLAQGVKLYSHETWRLVFGRGKEEGGGGASGGMEAVAGCVGAVSRYYVKMCDADNHVVREAACQAVAELANKLGRGEWKETLSPFVPILLQALIMCFHDESWPVRDEACLACGTFCLSYPTECQPELPTLFTRWTEQLTDQIWSVREDAAVALGDALYAYGPEMLLRLIDVLKRDLPAAKSQEAMTREEYKRRQNDIESHTDSQLYSCGSLAPKLKKKAGAGRIGCSNCLINRPKAPWEATDGCIYLLRELCVRLGGDAAAASVDTTGTEWEGHEQSMIITDEQLLPLMEELVDACRVRHFPQSDDLRTTLWKQLPVMANALGKQRFKRTYLQLFLNLLMKDLDDGGGSGAASGTSSQLSVHAAGQCAEELSQLVGRGIFRGRLEEDWQGEVFDRVMEERKRTAQKFPPAGAGVMDVGFSPFGPPGLLGGPVMTSPSSSFQDVGRRGSTGITGSGSMFGGGGARSTAAVGASDGYFKAPGTGLVDVL